MKEQENEGNWLTRRPWIFIIAFFILLTVGLAGMLTIAYKTYPGAVEPAPRNGESSEAPSEGS